MIANELHQFIINIVMSRAHGQVKVFWRHGQRKNISPFSVAWVSHKTRNLGSLIKFWQEWRIHLAYLKQLLQVLKEKASTIHLQVSWLHVKQIYFMAKLAIPSSSYQTYAHTETEYIFHIFSRLANHTKESEVESLLLADLLSNRFKCKLKVTLPGHESRSALA